MAVVEQAIFTSAETERSAGYQLVAKSPGVVEADARELAVWCPSHDSLLESGVEALSINFHPLPSGAYCVSRTMAAGWEYSGRGGHRVYTHCLVVAPEVLARFANNPFAVLRAAVAAGAMEVHERVPARVEPLALLGGSSPVDQTLLTRLASHPGPRKMAALVQAAFDAACLAVSGEPSAAELIAGLFSCLPPQCRAEFSFSTGLKFSSRRPFRVVALSGDRAEHRWIARQHNVVVLDLCQDSPAGATPVDGWARLIGRVLTAGRTSFLATELAKPRPDLTANDLDALGLQLLEELDSSAFRVKETAEQRPAPSGPGEGQTVKAGAISPGLAHAAHHQFGKSSAAAAARLAAAAPSHALAADSPAVLEKLERLDDVVYEALNGDQTAAEALQTLWPSVLAELGEHQVAESREQYLCYALRIWEECAGAEGVRDPTRAVHALDVLCVLFDQA
jgi:hypothetical protein